MVYGDFKHLPTRTASDKLLRGKAFNIAKNPKRDGYQRGLASMNSKFFDKNLLLSKEQELILKTNNWQKNDTNLLLKNLKNVKCTIFLKTIFGVHK